MHRYIRTPQAAVAAPTAEDDRAYAVRRQGAATRGPVQTLWASRPLPVRAGRLVAVRLRGDELRVGLATPDGLRWLSPHAVMTLAQAEKWASTSRFTPEAPRRRGW
jgi:hypothetical protein